MFKYTIPAFLQMLFPAYTWKVNTRDKQLFLTFDDGPHPEITPWVLDQLRQFNGKATFFCVGDNVRKYSDTFQQILAEGHRVGNHTYHHLNGWKTPKATYLVDVEKAAQRIQSNLYRPPYGRMRLGQSRELRKNYQIVMWDKLSCDYLKNLQVEESLQEMKKGAPGSILVFHDSEKAFRNLKLLLPRLLEHYTKEGYQFMSIPNK